MISKDKATIAVNTQFVRPTRLIANGRGPWRNSSAPTITGIGPGSQNAHTVRSEAHHSSAITKHPTYAHINNQQQMKWVLMKLTNQSTAKRLTIRMLVHANEKFTNLSTNARRTQDALSRKSIHLELTGRWCPTVPICRNTLKISSHTS